MGTRVAGHKIRDRQDSGRGTREGSQWLTPGPTLFLQGERGKEKKEMERVGGKIKDWSGMSSGREWSLQRTLRRGIHNNLTEGARREQQVTVTLLTRSFTQHSSCDTNTGVYLH